MKLVRLDYDNKEELEQITVRMSRDGGVALANLLGKLNGYGQKRLNIDSEMYDCLSSVFNMHDDDGTPNLHIDLKTLNDEK